MELIVEATHTEHRDNRHHHNHPSHIRNDSNSVTVIDFRVSFLVDPHIADWSGIVCVDKSGQFLPFDCVLKEYAEANSRMKEIELNKNVTGWNLYQLGLNIRNLAQANSRNMFHANDISVEFVKRNHIVKAYSSSLLMRLMKSCLFWFCMAISCLWVCLVPFYLLGRKKVFFANISLLTCIDLRPDHCRVSIADI
jgi:hypothetical protein